jgi:putative photosynthetic complex assembly protein
MDNALRRRNSHDGTLPIGMTALATVVLLVLCAVLAARLTGFEPARPQLQGVVESRTLGFRDMAGAVEIYDWNSGEGIAQYAPGEGSFLRGVMRSLVRQRRGMAVSDGTPFELTRYRGDRLVISDPATGEDIDLIAFGPSNVALFAALLPSAAQSAAPYLD